ncbi:MAG: hypothetical protein IPF83_11330 [Rhodanobacteraceae bacterium]|nr:hypothetical protein [Rhodanobacteraceae bacterium]MBP9154462.1 hypothetical protein [Xanthomonadales bacterium]
MCTVRVSARAIGRANASDWASTSIAKTAKVKQQRNVDEFITAATLALARSSAD